MKYIELFAGIGGFRVGLERTGDFECVWANEQEKYARAIYRYHFGDIDGRDITTIPIGDIPDCDLIVGGPPCQDFSVAGKRIGIGSTRGNLMLTTAEIIQKKRPRYFLLENVLGLLHSKGGQDFAYILNALWSDGDYCVQWIVLNSQDFGVPQSRRRVFLVGNLRGERRPEILPDKRTEKISAKTMRSKGISIRPCAVPAQKVLRKQPRFREPGENMFCMFLAHCHGIEITTSGKTQIRHLVPVETERLQGFLDNWTAYGVDDNGKEIEISDTQRYQKLGNAVTTNVIEHFGKVFMRISEENNG